MQELKGKRMRINYNATAMLAVNQLNKNDENLSVSTGKLSSGYKINRSKDNPSGYAMSRRMKAQLDGLMQAKENSNTGINVIESVDGALSEMHDMLQRMNELAIKAANGPLSDGDRELVDEEMQKLKEEIDRISETFEFNGQKLLDGTFALKGYVVADPGNANALTSDEIGVLSYSERIESGVYEFTFADGMEKLFDADDNFIGEKLLDEINEYNEKAMKWNSEHTDADKVELQTLNSVLQTEIKVTDPDGNDIKNITISAIHGSVMTLTGDDGFEVELDIRKKIANSSTVKIDFTGLGPMTLQVGSNEGQTLDIEIPNVGTKGLGIDMINVKSFYAEADAKGVLDGVDKPWAGTETDTDVAERSRNALDAIEKISAAIDKLSEIRAKLGAYQNRLEATSTSLEINHENMTGAYSSILDTDMSEEYTNYSTYQVLSQASTSVLAQANERPSQVLQLLQ